MKNSIRSLTQSLVLFVSFCVFTSFAKAASCVDIQCEALQFCYKVSKKYYFKNGSPSDTTRRFDSREYLPARTPLRGRTSQDIRGIFEKDRLVYVGSGSYHSGYFIDLIVVNPTTCDDIQIINIYSE